MQIVVGLARAASIVNNAISSVTSRLQMPWGSRATRNYGAHEVGPLLFGFFDSDIFESRSELF